MFSCKSPICASALPEANTYVYEGKGREGYCTWL
jgi:hypothetical protein